MPSQNRLLVLWALAAFLLLGACAQHPIGSADASPVAPAAPAPAPEVSAAPRPLVVERVEVRDLKSKINGIEYELRVALPHGYEDSEARYPVVFALDADYSFLIARGITDHLSEREHLDEVIVVGIAYGGPLHYRENRTRDYTPVFAPDGGYGPEYQKLSGGGPAFLDAIQAEIIPFIDRTYRTLTRDRTLVGHSYGGLFATWTLLTRPGLFANYVIASPSLWYDDRLIFALEETYAAKHKALPARAYLCAGSNEAEIMPNDLREFTAQLRGRGYEELALDSLVMANETHNSIFPGCLSNGLRFVLEGR